jgi:ribosomal protein L15
LVNYITPAYEYSAAVAITQTSEEGCIEQTSPSYVKEGGFTISFTDTANDVAGAAINASALKAEVPAVQTASQTDTESAEKDINLMWLIIVLIAIFVAEVAIVVVYWAKRAKRELNKNTKATRTNSVALTALLASSILGWQLAVIIVLAAAIVFVLVLHIVHLFKISKSSGATADDDNEEGNGSEQTQPFMHEVIEDTFVSTEYQEEPIDEEYDDNAEGLSEEVKGNVVVDEDEEIDELAPVEYDVSVDDPTNSYDDDDGPYEAVADADVSEAAQTVAEQLALTDDEGDVSEVLKKVDYDKGIAYVTRYKKSFQARLIQSWDESKEYYSELKNEILSYKSVRSRVSWNYDCFSVGNTPIIKMDVRGKTLCVYFPLNPDDFAGTKYKVELSQIKKCEDVPCLYRMKNATRVSNAKELIADVMKKIGVERLARTRRDNYEFPYETTPRLVERGLAKEYLAKEKYDDFITRSNSEKEREENNEKQKQKRRDKAAVVRMRREEISVGDVAGLLTDAVAAEMVEDERSDRVYKGKKDIINVDTISENYGKGEIVNLESLKQKGLIAENVDFVKVLARGMLTKPLTVEAQDFSLEAIKMIVLTGGAAIKV